LTHSTKLRVNPEALEGLSFEFNSTFSIQKKMRLWSEFGPQRWLAHFTPLKPES
jgi:hypothetical protein